MTMANVVSARIYLPDTPRFQPMNEVVSQLLPERRRRARPSRPGLPASDYVVEMTFVASSAPRVVDDGGRESESERGRSGRASASMSRGCSATRRRPRATSRPRRVRRWRASGRALDAAGCTPADVVDGARLSHRPLDVRAMNDEYRAFFGQDFPARATVQSGPRRADGLVEIMVTAVPRQMTCHAAARPRGSSRLPTAGRAAHHHTPLLTSRILSERTGFDVRLKAEMFQRTGSYKIRGPLNKFALADRGGAAARRDLLVGRQSRAGRRARGAASTASRPSSAWPRTPRRRRSRRRAATAPRSCCTARSGTRPTRRPRSWSASAGSPTSIRSTTCS